MKTSTGGEQLDEVGEINMLLKPVFALLCPSVPLAQPDADWYYSLFPGWLTGRLADLALHLVSLPVGSELSQLVKCSNIGFLAFAAQHLSFCNNDLKFPY